MDFTQNVLLVFGGIGATAIMTLIVGHYLISAFFAHKEEMINRMIDSKRGEL